MKSQLQPRVPRTREGLAERDELCGCDAQGEGRRGPQMGRSMLLLTHLPTISSEIKSKHLEMLIAVSKTYFIFVESKTWLMF